MNIEALYHFVFLFIVTCLSIPVYVKYHSTRIVINERPTSGFICAILLAIFIGLRPPEYGFGDTVGIWKMFQFYINKTFVFDLSGNFIFDNLLLYLASINADWLFFTLIISFVYFISRYISCKKLFPNNAYTAFIVFLGAFLTYASAINGFKAGAAASLFCCAIAWRENKFVTLLFLLLSWGFHHAMHICIIVFIFAYFYKNTKHYMLFWLFALVMAIGHVTYFQTWFAGFTDEGGVRYLLTDDENNGWYTGMRYDFVAYSFMPILLVYYVKYKKNYKNVMYDFISNIYIILNAIWLLCMYANFTNRIAALSWALYPLVLVYPFLQTEEITGVNKNRMLSNILLAHLGFTLIMNIFYY